jgi:hypothetical protein
VKHSTGTIRRYMVRRRTPASGVSPRQCRGTKPSCPAPWPVPGLMRPLNASTQIERTGHHSNKARYRW